MNKKEYLYSIITEALNNAEQNHSSSKYTNMLFQND